MQLAEIEAAMLKPEFHSDSQSIDKLKNHVELKKQLEHWMDHWTVFQEKLESLP